MTFFCGDLQNSKLPDVLVTWYLHAVDMVAALSSSATSALCCTVSVSVPSAPGKRKMQTSARNKQSQSLSDCGWNTYKEKESIFLRLLDLCLEMLRKSSGFVRWRNSESHVALNYSLRVWALESCYPWRRRAARALPGTRFEERMRRLHQQRPLTEVHAGVETRWVHLSSRW